MIDIKLVRDYPEIVKDNLLKRGKKELIKVLDEIIEKDKKWRSLKGEADNLRAERNKISKEIADFKKRGDKKKVSELMKRAKDVPDEIAKIEGRGSKIERDVSEKLGLMPNLLDKNVPVGKDEKDNSEIKKWGKIPKFDFEIVNHAELAENLGLADFDAGRANAGQGFNYLFGDLARLDNALQRYGIDFILRKGFKLVIPPMMLNYETLSGALSGLKDFEEVVYKVEKEDLYLIGTAEHSLVGMFKNRTVNRDSLPLSFAAVTPCFRKEIGAHGLDTKGLYRMHQFNKVEQVVFSLPEKSSEMLEEMQKISEEFFQSLKIPYRVIEICSGDLGNKFAKQYDIEAWFPRQEKYGEVTSCGNCTDFQARALNIKYWDKGERKFLHILNNTMVATSRAMVAILENYQQKDGSVKVPDVLHDYMQGVKVLKA